MRFIMGKLEVCVPVSGVWIGCAVRGRGREYHGFHQHPVCPDLHCLLVCGRGDTLVSHTERSRDRAHKSEGGGRRSRQHSPNTTKWAPSARLKCQLFVVCAVFSKNFSNDFLRDGPTVIACDTVAGEGHVPGHNETECNPFPPLSFLQFDLSSTRPPAST